MGERVRYYCVLLRLALCMAVGVLCLLGAGEILSQEIRPGAKWLDNNGVFINAHGGGILYYNHVYWWFGEHKTEGKVGNTAQVGVHCYSSDDLVNWRDEGIALTVSEDADSPIARGCILERPKVLYNEKTQQFVMYFHLERKSYGYKDARTGIAVANEVSGPYRFVKCLRPCAGHWPLNVADSDKQPLSEPEVEQISKLNLTGAEHPEGGSKKHQKSEFIK